MKAAYATFSPGYRISVGVRITASTLAAEKIITRGLCLHQMLKKLPVTITLCNFFFFPLGLVAILHSTAFFNSFPSF